VLGKDGGKANAPTTEKGGMVMNRMRAFRWVIASISVLVTLAPVAADFTILELDTLGGTYHGAQAINNAGQVVGRSYTASGVEHAFLWQRGAITDLGTLGGSYSHALGINEAGQVAGFSMTFGDPFRHAFLWQNGVMTDLGTLGDSLIDTRATAINNAGQVVGHASSVTVGGPQHAFLWQNGTMTDLGTLGGTHSGALDINDAGQVVGASTTAGDASGHAFLWQNGTMTDLGTLGGDYSEATGINNLGQVVGISTTADGAQHAFLWQDGTMINLDPSGGTFSRAWGINDAGQVVGGICYVIFDEFGFEAGFVCWAFLWTSSEGMVALDSLIPPNSGWEQLAAMGINEAGDIVGSGLLRGESRAFMLTTGRLASVSLDPTTVHGGTTSTGTVHLNTAAGGLTVTLSSGNPAVATVPASVTVPAGVTNATFTVPTSLVTASTPVAISATLGGVTKSSVLTVNPASLLSFLSFNPTSVLGGTPSIGTVTLSAAAPPGGATVTLSSSNPAATVPVSVTVPAGVTQQLFTVTTSAVAALTAVTISGSHGGATRSVALIVTPAIALSSVRLSPANVTGGSESTGTVTLSVAAPAGGATVTLSSSNSDIAAVPASVTVPPGGWDASFPVSTNAVTSATTVAIHGGYNGSEFALLTVTPPSLSFLGLNPSSVNGGTPSTGTVTLSAVAPAGGAAVALSSSDTAVAAVPATVTVAAGATSANFAVSTVACTPGSATISGVYGDVTMFDALSVKAASDTLTIHQADYLTNRRELRVGANSSSSTATLQVLATSSGESIGTLRNLGDGKYSGRFTRSMNPQNITVRSSSCGSATKNVRAR